MNGVAGLLLEGADRRNRALHPEPCSDRFPGMKAFQSPARRTILGDTRARAQLRGLIQQRGPAVAAGARWSASLSVPALAGTVSTSGGLTYTVRIVPTR